MSQTRLTAEQTAALILRPHKPRTDMRCLTRGVRCVAVASRPDAEGLHRLNLKIVAVTDASLRCVQDTHYYRLDPLSLGYEERMALIDTCIEGEIEIAPDAILNWAPPSQDGDEMREHLLAVVPGLTGEMIDHLVEIAEAIPAAHTEGGLDTLVHAEFENGQLPEGGFSFSLDQVDRDFQFQACIATDLLPEGTSFETVLDRTYEEGDLSYRTSIIHTDRLVLRVVNWLGEHSDDSCDASVRVDLMFGDDEARAACVAKWKREEAVSIAETLEALCRPLTAEVLQLARAEVEARLGQLAAKAA